MKHKFSKLIVVLTATTFVIASCNSGSNGNSNQSADADANATNSSNSTDMATLGSSNYQTLTSSSLGDGDSICDATSDTNATSFLQNIGYGAALFPGGGIFVALGLFSFSGAFMAAGDICQGSDISTNPLLQISNTMNKIESQVSEILDITDSTAQALNKLIADSVLDKVNKESDFINDNSNKLNIILSDYQRLTIYNTYFSRRNFEDTDGFNTAKKQCTGMKAEIKQYSPELGKWRSDFRLYFLSWNSSFWNDMQVANENYLKLIEVPDSNGLPPYNYRFFIEYYNATVNKYATLIPQMLSTAMQITEVELLYMYACPQEIGIPLTSSSTGGLADIAGIFLVAPITESSGVEQFIIARKKLYEIKNKEIQKVLPQIQNNLTQITNTQAENILNGNYAKNIIDPTDFNLATENPNLDNINTNGLNQCTIVNFSPIQSSLSSIGMSSLSVICNVSESNSTYTLEKFTVDFPRGAPISKVTGTPANYYQLTDLKYDPLLGYPHFIEKTIESSEITSMADTNDDQQASLDYEYANGSHISDPVNAPIANIYFDDNIKIFNGFYIPTNTMNYDVRRKGSFEAIAMLNTTEAITGSGFIKHLGPYALHPYYTNRIGWDYQYNIGSIYGHKFRTKLTEYFTPDNLMPEKHGITNFNDLQVIFRLSCLTPEPDCVARMNYPAPNMQQLAFADGTTITIWPGYPTNVRSTSPTPQLINRQKYHFESSPELASWAVNPNTITNHIYLNGELNKRFGNASIGYKSTEIMKSDNGQYSLVFNADDNLLQVKDNSTNTIKYNNIFNIANNKAKIAGVSFARGDIIIYDENQNPLWSVSQQYLANNQVWLTDPYAELALDDKGNLIVYTSNALNNIGYTDSNIKFPTYYTHILWSSPSTKWQQNRTGNPVSESAIWSLQYTPFN